MNEPEHIWWATQWYRARHLIRALRSRSYNGAPDLAELNYATYLTEVFSWMFEHWRIYDGRPKGESHD